MRVFQLNPLISNGIRKSCALGSVENLWRNCVQCRILCTENFTESVFSSCPRGPFNRNIMPARASVTADLSPPSKRPFAVFPKEPNRPRGGGKVKGKGRLSEKHPKSSDDGMQTRQIKSADGIGSSEPHPRKGRLRRAVRRNGAGNRSADADGLRRARAERAVRNRQPCLRTLALMRTAGLASAGQPWPPSGGHGSSRRAAGRGR